MQTLHEEIREELLALSTHTLDWTYTPFMLDGSVMVILVIVDDCGHIHIYTYPLPRDEE